MNDETVLPRTALAVGKFETVEHMVRITAIDPLLKVWCLDFPGSNPNPNPNSASTKTDATRIASIKLETINDKGAFVSLSADFPKSMMKDASQWCHVAVSWSLGDARADGAESKGESKGESKVESKVESKRGDSDGTDAGKKAKKKTEAVAVMYIDGKRVAGGTFGIPLGPWGKIQQQPLTIAGLAKGGGGDGGGPGDDGETKGDGGGAVEGGDGGGGGACLYQGEISELRLWSVGRNEWELSRDSIARRTQSEPGLVACWPLHSAHKVLPDANVEVPPWECITCGSENEGDVISCDMCAEDRKVDPPTLTTPCIGALAAAGGGATRVAYSPDNCVGSVPADLPLFTPSTHAGKKDAMQYVA